MKKIGILGGTFDPPHFGHLLIAEQIRDCCHLDEIWFLPTKIPPHKPSSNGCSDEDRIEMIYLAIKDNPSFHVSLLEFERQGPSYTIDTVKEIKEKYPADHFYFIIGGDMIEFLPKWRSIEELLELISFIGVRRPGHSITSPYLHKIRLEDVAQLDISSSKIRERISDSKSIKYLLPEAVLNYIEERDLYGKR